MMQGWLLIALMILVVFGCIDGLLFSMALKRKGAIMILVALWTIGGGMFSSIFGTTIRTFDIALIGLLIFLNSRQKLSADRMGFVLSTLASAAMVFGVRTLFPMESGALPLPLDLVLALPAAAGAQWFARGTVQVAGGAVCGMALQAMIAKVFSLAFARGESGFSDGLLPAMVLSLSLHTVLLKLKAWRNQNQMEKSCA